MSDPSPSEPRRRTRRASTRQTKTAAAAAAAAAAKSDTTMVRIAPERVLLIGDSLRELQAALSQAAPAAQITSVPSVFDGIAELAGGSYTTVIAPAGGAVERRPEAAVRTLREVGGGA